jgi:hypothetical protein
MDDELRLDQIDGWPAVFASLVLDDSVDVTAGQQHL